MSRSEVLCEPRGPGLGSIKPNEMRHAQAFVAPPKRGIRPQPLESSPADFVGELVPMARYRKP
jgi:hypothetical protein